VDKCIFPPPLTSSGGYTNEETRQVAPIALPQSICSPGILRRFKIRAERRTDTDRRSGRDRRKLFDVHYLSDDGFLKGLRVERRSEPERREDWIRVSNWGSVPTED
jgi:hypothetical protein